MLFRHEYDPVAEEYAKKAVELDPKLPLAHALLGELYLYKSRVPEAVEQFQKELELNPGEAAVYYKLADGSARLQKYEEAERLLQRSIWLNATSTGPYYLWARSFKKGRTAPRCVPCSVRWQWIPTIPSPITCLDRRTGNWAGPKRRSAN
jgi:tetratricopeptide (TPR) repeat protein